MQCLQSQKELHTEITYSIFRVTAQSSKYTLMSGSVKYRNINFVRCGWVGEKNVTDWMANTLYFVIIIHLSLLFIVCVCLDCKESQPSANRRKEEKGSYPSPRGGCAQLQLNINCVYNVCQLKWCYPSPLKPPLQGNILNILLDCLLRTYIYNNLYLILFVYKCPTLGQCSILISYPEAVISNA